MQYHSIIKKIHTYVGMVLAPFILLEAITGLILVEPWLIGDELSDSSLTLLNTIEMLHQGEIINLNFPWLLDILALSIILLTLTGIYLSMQLFRVRRR